jgi:hypothetical protein
MLPPDDFIKELAYVYDVNLDAIGWFQDSISKQKDKLLETVRQMAWVWEDKGPLADIGWTPSIPWQEQQQWPQQPNMLPNIQNKWLPPVTQPMVPTLNNSLSPVQKLQ